MKKKNINIYNNISKQLNLCIYKIYYFNKKNKKKILNFFNKKYNFDNLKKIFKNISLIINNKILNIYEKKEYYNNKKNEKNKILYNIISLLNKSHIYIYIYYNYIKDKIFIIKIDLEIYTYDIYSPTLKTINYLISKFKSDIIIINYKIYEIIKNNKKKKIFINYKINSLQNFISKKYKNIYDLSDINLYKENIFQTKIIVKKINIKNNIFNYKKTNFNKIKKKHILKSLWKKFKKIYYKK